MDIRPLFWRGSTASAVYWYTSATSFSVSSQVESLEKESVYLVS